MIDMKTLRVLRYIKRNQTVTSEMVKEKFQDNMRDELTFLITKKYIALEFDTKINAHPYSFIQIPKYTILPAGRTALSKIFWSIFVPTAIAVATVIATILAPFISR